MYTPIAILLFRQLGLIIIILLTSLACHIVSREKFRWSSFSKVMLVMLATMSINVNFLSPDSPLKFLLASVSIFLSYLWAYRFTGTKLLLRSFILLLVEFLADILVGLLFLRLFDSQTIEGMRYMTIPETCLLQFVSGTGMVLLALLYRMLCRIVPRIHPSVSYLVRPIMLLIIIILIFYWAISNAPESDQLSRFQSVLPSFILMALLLLIGITYIVQDIRFYKQAQENKRLQQQDSLQSLMLLQTRTFRHNIANMLYGFQGVISNGDTSAIEEYYNAMVKACQMVNNENVTAIKRIPSPAISALLVNKILRANEQGIPFFVSVDEGAPIPRMRDDEVAQVLGILLDNALEAAAQSAAPHVSFDARKTENACCITIRNSYAGDAPVFSDHPVSTKEGHEGLGLHSLHHILKKHPDVLFNIYTRDRYVEAVLAIE